MKTKELIDLSACWLLASFGASVYAHELSEDALREKMLELHEQAEDIQAAADSENRALTQTENSRINRIYDSFRGYELQLAGRQSRGRQAGGLPPGPRRPDRPLLLHHPRQQAARARLEIPRKRGGGAAPMSPASVSE